MHFTNVFAFVLMFLSINSMESPLSPPTSVTPDANGLDERQLLIPAIIIEVVSRVAADIIIDLIHFKSDMHAAQKNFTQQTIIDLRPKCPGKNLLIFHNKKSRFSAVNAVHVHYELKLPNIGPLRFTRGYEVYVFDSGTFSLAGDGGFENWAAAGCLSGPAKKVVFRKCNSTVDSG